MRLDNQTYKLTDQGKLGSISLVVGLVGLIVSAAGYFANSTQFFHSYLVAFVFWLSLSLGGLFFTMLHHLVDAEWSTVIRRWSESAMACLPMMAILVIPILWGMHDLYHWSHADVVAQDELLQAKAGYLNPTFFTIRSVAYFLIWSVLATLLHSTSLKQDEGHSDALTQKLRKISAPGMILFALTVSFSSFDWMMSLDAHWYSTIYGVYWFSGSFVGILCFMVLLGLYQRQKSVLDKTVTLEHYHDLGKLIFGFTVFWAYMGFSQYLLIWYANIPEETVWFTHRWNGGWKWMSLTLVFGHFTIPFLALMTRAAKRNLIVLGTAAVWLLIMRWVDIYWLTFPTLYEHGPEFSWMDISTLAGVGGIFLWFFWRKYTANPVIPIGDRSLASSKKFENQ
ncbi:MAG: hypothetical protein V3T31_07735 [candidate division Zixibacteria bacterium]